MVLSVLSLAGCGAKSEPLKLGLGSVNTVSKVTSADADTNGAGEITNTFAAVLVDGEGKIVDCKIDTIDYALGFTSKGKYVESAEFKSKYEAGADYGMIAYGGAKKEWYEQVDAFVALVKGKTAQDIKALVATDGKGTTDVINAGCTIQVTDFVKAVEEAINNAKESSAKEGDVLKLGIISTQSGKDATEEAEGSNTVDTTVSAVATKDGKVTAIVTDAVSESITFDTKGVSKVAAGTELKTKAEHGDNYNMAAYGTDLNGDGTVKEWYAQADAFDTACVGKTADEISTLAADKGYGVEALQTAGCTINIADMVKAAVKAAK
jgi:hypothetical protein